MNTLFADLAVSMPGTWELIIIAGLMLLFFGPKRLPELARSIGGAITSFKEGLSASKPADDADKRVAAPPAPAPKPAADAGKEAH